MTFWRYSLQPEILLRVPFGYHQNNYAKAPKDVLMIDSVIETVAPSSRTLHTTSGRFELRLRVSSSVCIVDPRVK